MCSSLMTTINFVERDTKMSKRNQTTLTTKIYVCTATDPKTGWKTINSLTGKGNKTTVLLLMISSLMIELFLTIMTLPNHLMISL